MDTNDLMRQVEAVASKLGLSVTVAPWNNGLSVDGRIAAAPLSAGPYSTWSVMWLCSGEMVNGGLVRESIPVYPDPKMIVAEVLGQVIADRAIAAMTKA